MAPDRDSKADAAAEKARAKALRPWYKKKRFMLPLVLVVLIAIAAASGGGDKATEKAKEEASEAAQEARAGEPVGRADAQKEDQVLQVGEGAKVSGYTGTLKSAGFVQTISDFESDGYLVCEVTIVNRDDKAQPYNLFDWKLQTPQGQVIDPTFTSVKDVLGSGDLVQGGTVSGKVIFEIGATKGEYVVIYKPDPFDAARGIWRISL